LIWIVSWWLNINLTQVSSKVSSSMTQLDSVMLNHIFTSILSRTSLLSISWLLMLKLITKWRLFYILSTTRIIKDQSISSEFVNVWVVLEITLSKERMYILTLLSNFCSIDLKLLSKNLMMIFTLLVWIFQVTSPELRWNHRKKLQERDS